MSSKNLFDKGKSYKVLSSVDPDTLGKDAESYRNIQAKVEDKERFVPNVDFSNAANFVKYGSAKKYYENAFDRIRDEYPYDGSRAEKQEFLNDSSYLDLYLYENEYPRTTGYAIFSSNGWGTQSSETEGWGVSGDLEYIEFYGGPHTSSNGMENKTIHSEFSASNIYDANIYDTEGVLSLGQQGSRESNLKFDWTTGQTVEFWLKKDEFLDSDTEKEVIFDLWNGEASGSDSYGRFTIYLTSSTSVDMPIRMNIMSGTTGYQNVNVDVGLSKAQISDGTWRHFALAAVNQSGQSSMEVYLNGVNTSTVGPISMDIQEVTGALRARIGALTSAPSGNIYHGLDLAGAGKLSASIDEFRYWKVQRTHEEISKNYFRHVDGGTNTDVSNTELGVYFKFNEGITTDTNTDSTVLDYSGRITNGNWVGYPGSMARNTGSAIVLSNASSKEESDPIIYANHPDVISKRAEFSTSGSAYDGQNITSLYHSLPTWIIEEDDKNGELLNLTQIISSYLDTLHSQIGEINKLKDINYVSSSQKPYPFSNRLLESAGLFAPEIFVDATVLEQIRNQSEDELYEKDLSEVKNLIYQNIYNNLVFIYKSKGTEKSFRNLIRCYGVDDELIRFNLYGNNITHKLRDNFRTSVVKKRYADFSRPARFEATVTHQTASSNPNAHTTYVSSSSRNIPRTSEVEVIFPKKYGRNDINYFRTDFLSSSIFGWHRVNTSNDDQNYAWYTTAASDRSLQVYAVRTAEDSKDAYFVLTNRDESLFVTSSVYQNIYDDTKWNFALRTYLGKKDHANKVSGSAGTTSGDSVILELYGCNVELGVVKNQFTLTGSLQRSSLTTQYIYAPRRYYIGSHRTDFTGSVVTKTDLKISSLRHWESFLEDAEVIAHAKDPENYGVLRPNESTYLFVEGLEGFHIPKSETLSLHWNFDDVTGSDSSGEFLVNDFSSGSLAKSGRYPNASERIASVTEQHTGRGFFFENDSTSSVSFEYAQSSKQTLPEVVTSYDMTNILDFDDETFVRDSRSINHYFAIEKSMYQTISDEMLNMFGTIVGFNNLIGEPVNRYRLEYKELGKLRNLFFEKVENEPDLDKYVEFYRWIDSSLSLMLRQLIPASANTSEDVRTMIESHALERSKYHHKFPGLELKLGTIEAGANGINRFEPDVVPNWRFAHAPLSDDEADNSIYWKYAEVYNPVLSSSDAGVNSTRGAIISSKVSARDRRYSTPYSITARLESEDKATKYGTGRKVIHGGVNFPPNQRPAALFDKYNEYYTSGVTTLSRINNLKDINDVVHPMHKKYFAIDGTLAFSEDKVSNYVPLRMLSGSIETGVNSVFDDFQVLNIHSFESYLAGGETPMQSPFTEKNVGGFASRHTSISDGSDTKANRAESYHLATSTSTVEFYGPGNSNFGTDNPRSVFSRNVKVKRPVNLENLKITGSNVLGNYSNIREVVQVSGRAGGDSQFVRSEGVTVTNITSSQISGIVDTEVPFLSSSEHTMIERFSAPGGPETSHGGLDAATTQYSVYSVLPYRNLLVRQPLNNLLSASTSQFGFKPGVTAVESDYSGVANYHKINRNTLRRIEYNNEFSGDEGTVTTGSVSDNGFFTRPIPQSDLQYQWLTQSYVSTELGGTKASGRTMLGYSPADFEVSTSSGYVNSIVFVSESNIVSTTGIVVDFVGLNTVISEPVSASEQTLGYPLGTSMVSYLTNNFGSVSSIGNSLVTVLDHRGDSFGFNSWNQVRTGQHPVARVLREQQIISVEVGDKQTYSTKGVLPAQRYGSFTQFRESPVISKYKPIIQDFSDISVESSYANNISFFSNLDLNKISNFSKEAQTYDRIVSLYDNSFSGLTYRETVYPAEKNAYANRIRQREGYSINYWHSDRDTRNDNKADKVSLGGRSTYSIWALDSKPTFETFTVDGTKAENDATDPTGELQNYGTQAHYGTKSHITASALYSLKHWSSTTASVVAPSGMVIPQTASAPPAGGDIFGQMNVGGGNAEWQAGELAGRIIDGIFVTGSSKRSNPAYDSYQDYAEEIRLHGKDYSVVPEFRISDHMSYYVSTMGGDFLAQNSGTFDIFGATASDEFPTDSSFGEFYNVYTNSDFLKYFDVVKKQHSEIGNERTISLSCKALMKFLPYNGFYPSERTLQMATQYSSSYASNVRFTGADSSLENAKIRPFLEPMFAPGIVYNSIKSGIGVPYPVITASYDVQQLGDSYYAISSSGDQSLRFIDFEAAVNPEKYLAGFNIHDAEPHPSASLNLTASWNGKGDPLYRMMASNFFGECPEFFLPNGNMSTITSLPESDPRFGNAISGSTYVMRIKMYRSMNKAREFVSSVSYELPQDNPTQTDLHETFTMYSRPSAFYHALTGRNALAQTDHDGVYSQRMLDAHSGYNWAATPPYYHGEAWFDLGFTPSETKKYKLDEILGSLAGTFSLRFDRAGANVGNDAGFYNDVGESASPGSIRNNILNLEDVLITDGRTRIKSVKYDPATGKPLEVSDDPTANHVALVIQPKWETPMFNFGSSVVNVEGNITMPTYASESVPRGMWHQFGLPPDSPEKGIFFEVSDIPKDWLDEHPSAYTSYADSKSLADLLGLPKDPKRLGEVASSKEVSEAIVAVPFVEDESRRKLFLLPPDVAKQAREGQLPDTNSIQQMFNKMQNYVFPPRFDFITNDSIKPFAMYIFEFTHTFDQDDLVHIWQNLPPKSIEKVEKKTVSITHDFLADQLLGEEMPEKLRWMVFKVKKKAVKNYYSKVASKSGDNLDDNRYKFEFRVAGRKQELDYSYNWPYDFFSLVEMVKIDAEIDIEGEEE